MNDMPGPLAGMLVADASRMLPGAVLARQLLDLGARLVKIEDPSGGDAMRRMPPFAGGVGAGFAALLRGAESAALDLKSARGAEAFRRLAARADVAVESFRPGTLERWELSYESLAAANPRLVFCSLPGYPSDSPLRARALHDLNVSAMSGALALSGAATRLQLADVTTGLLAASSILAALLARSSTGRGARIEQPLSAGPVPFVAWAWADAAAGGGGVYDLLFAGRCACYRTYLCADGAAVALAALEPKFWREVLRVLELPELEGDAMDAGPRGEEAARLLASRFAGRASGEWLAVAAERDLPITRVNGVGDALLEPAYAGAAAAPTFLGSFRSASGARAPALGEHTEALLSEMAL